MSFCRDRSIKKFCFFLFFMVLLYFLLGVWTCVNQTRMVKTMFLSHNAAVAATLLERGVSESIIAEAVTSTRMNQAGIDFLAMAGMTEDTQNHFLPQLFKFQRTTGYTILVPGILLSVLLSGGVWFFFQQREKLYQQAAAIVRNYMKGDFSHHLPQTEEGAIYQLFACVVQLATMLQSKHETEHKTKLFLKQSISDISHQLKTPLAALMMYQEIIEHEPDQIDTVIEFTEKTGQALKRMEQLIQSLLKITRLDAGGIVFEKSRYQISELVLHSVNELTTRAKKEHKEIKMDGSPEETLVCDMEWTSEAVLNIVKNALDHTDTGGIVRISWERSPSMIRILIADNGHGIAPEDIHHIFKRFYRSKNSLNTQGVGLGLPLAKSIIEGQGGVVSVQSDEKKGTVFSISFLTKL